MLEATNNKVPAASKAKHFLFPSFIHSIIIKSLEGRFLEEQKNA